MSQPPDIEKMKAEQNVNGLIKAIGHQSSSVRQAAVQALGQIGDLRAVESLVAALKDQGAQVRQAAAQALDKLGWQSDKTAFEEITTEKVKETDKASEKVVEKVKETEGGIVTQPVAEKVKETEGGIGSIQPVADTVIQPDIDADAVTDQLADGRAFIRTDERPSVETPTLDQPGSVEEPQDPS